MLKHDGTGDMEGELDGRVVERRLLEWEREQLVERLEAMLSEGDRPLVRQLARLQDTLTARVRDDEDDAALPLLAEGLRLPLDTLREQRDEALRTI